MKAKVFNPFRRIPPIKRTSDGRTRFSVEKIELQTWSRIKSCRVLNKSLKTISRKSLPG